MFLEYNSVTIRNILMILGRIIEQVSMECVAYKNDNSAYLRLLIMYPDPYSSFIFVSEHNSIAIRNILMILGKIIE